MSYRNTDETSFHILMPTLDESVAQNDIERVLLNEFKESFKIYEDCQYKQQALRCEMQSAKGDLLRCLRDKAQRIAQRQSLEDKIIVALKNEPHLKNLYEREKAKVLKTKESEKLEFLLSQIKGYMR